MASLDQLIRQNFNPFDPTTFKPGNFWKETQQQDQEVSSIHQAVINSIEQTLAALMRDRKTRTLMLLGDSGSGKSYLLGRLKRQLNDRACFAYVGPWPDSQFIWRHVLRQTVDSLLETPAGQHESQILRWLKGLEIFKKPGFGQRILGERNVFIRDLRASFPVGIYRARDFFSVLYDLLNPELYFVACDWLRGEDLDEADLKALRVKKSIDSEDAAQKVLGNLGLIADSTQPIVICFDNLDNIPMLPSGKQDLQALFNVNSTLHNEKFNNFLILVSLISSNWRANQEIINPADKDRIHQALMLRAISLDQATALWASRLALLHQQADPPPTSAIAPLTRDWLEHMHPGGKLRPRDALMLAEKLIRVFKLKGKLPEIPVRPSESVSKPADAVDEALSVADSTRASFELTWQKEFKQVGQVLQRISQFSSPELIRRLQEVLEALAVSDIQLGLLPSRAYSSYSLGHHHSARVGIVWTEDGNLTSFYHVMKACQRIVDRCDRLYLIRSASLGTVKNKGYQVFNTVFGSGEHFHLKPDLESVQYLETYHRLLNAAAGGELVIGSKTPHIPELQAFVRESRVLANCSLLQQLEIVRADGGTTVMLPNTTHRSTSSTHLRPDAKPALSKPNLVHSNLKAAQRYISNRMSTEMMIGLQAMIESTQVQVPDLSADEIEKLIATLCEANQIRLLHPHAKRENQLLCWVPAELP